MPTYVAVVEGTGIKIPAVPEPIIGFFATRRVRAADERSAVYLAEQLILEEWRSSDYGAANIGQSPRLRIDSIRTQGLLERTFSRVPNTGYTFYSEK